MSDRSYLEEVSIRNLGVIEESSLTFSPGLNVLTGETGAGKTMVLTALSLVLGGKSDSSLVRTGAERLVATAQFHITQTLTSQFDDIGAAIDDGSLILTRQVFSDGKSKAQAGGVSVPAGTLSSLSETLIEIHGQSANHQIVKPSRQRELLDAFAGSALHNALVSYQEIFNSYVELKERISTMKSASKKRDSEIEEIEDFLNQWQKLKPTRGEFASIEDELSRLSSVEDLRVASTTTSEILGDEENGVLPLLARLRKALETAEGKDSRLDSISHTIKDGNFILEDAAREISSYIQSLEADPIRLDFLQLRKNELLTFVRKHSPETDPDQGLIDLAARAKSARLSIEDLKGGDERISELENELSDTKKKLLTKAISLTEIRVTAAKELSHKVSEEIHQLSMPHTEFFLQVISPDYNGPLKESDFTQIGCDEVSMLIQGHHGGPKIALGKGASGGEMSRIMLALQVVLAQSQPVGTYIFDEVDAGVGGKAAIEVGRRLHQLAEHAQVIVVTHLPQVAAWAQSHFVVKKNSDGKVTQSDVELLTQELRITEIARMLAGLEGSTSAREHAAELLALRS